ncbi:MULTISPECIES: ABC transporter substrate-binding protein [Deinococcus]|uniref:ABC transporter substrate-binding protein n=2 Tax=Deinococcus soli (ex Cha et al. 2016) TaxID=1309411 RepID=A0A0F7JID0_9DEIO|nr:MULTISPECIES: ABC transporter substrate-binding protein [Deinococcus]AKH15721.1 ABC transporter substrate-binding protein [Deinococcus soli (ex Cha et al. 2016)]MDK2011348.1 ABC transporter substrate-binding protein [Deinococcus sp. 43]MDR6217528.1 trehalose/maltose transport system substrate-binding protein [Deinococcus soli (ex Cha et al. 2016)]MDR6326837.1 trehalose/maltose transport system substrate-binding protein [Deinococcus soli (ex Cha et al. 2016)]MDR6750437.1 trehalose/maltose tr
MKKVIALVSLSAAIAVSSNASAVTVTLACGAVGQELELCKAGAARWAKKTGNEVKIFESPNLTNDRLGLYQQQLAAKSSDIDVYQLDVVWPGLLAQHFVDLKGKVPAAEVNAHFKGIIDANTVNGKLVAIPWFTDAGLLYYRTDLLKKYGFTAAPKTWTELALMAKKIQTGEQKTNKAFTGFVWQGKNYEGLTCDALEWVVSFGGGTIVDNTGKVTINNAQAAKALDTAASWIKSISPAGVTTYAEEEARGIFQSGNAAFMRNWPYAWALGQGDDSKVKGKIGVAPLPSGGSRNAATLGGWQLGVSSYSKNQAAAIDLVRYLAGPAEQKIRAIEGAYNPTIQSLYKDKDVLAKNPFFGSLYSVFTSAVARPSGPTKGKYNQVSQAFSTAVSDVLNGKMKGQAAVAKLAGDLNRIKGRGW